MTTNESGETGRTSRRRSARRPAAADTGAANARGTPPRRVRREGAGRGFYAAHLTDAERADLAAATGRGIEDEVDLLRVLARRALDAGDLRDTLAILKALASAHKIQQAAGSRAARELDEAMNTVLDELAEEYGLPL